MISNYSGIAIAIADNNAAEVNLKYSNIPAKIPADAIRRKDEKVSLIHNWITGNSYLKMNN